MASSSSAHRSSSLHHSTTPEQSGLPSSSDPASAQAQAQGQHYHPHEPTIDEEAVAQVSRSLRHSQGGGVPNGESSADGAGVGAGVNGNGNGNGSRAPRDKARTRMVGDWVLQKTLGAGSMGKVKLATHAVTKERVSLVSSRSSTRARASAAREWSVGFG